MGNAELGKAWGLVPSWLLGLTPPHGGGGVVPNLREASKKALYVPYLTLRTGGEAPRIVVEERRFAPPASSVARSQLRDGNLALSSIFGI